VWLVLAFASGGLGFIAYLIAWIVIPEAQPQVMQAQVVQPQSGPPVS
jgi:phage shock protein PspC (stress-responsive transcriptional regulator)